MGLGNSSQTWKSDFELLEINQLTPYRKLVRHKMRRDRFQLLTLTFSNQQDINFMAKRLKARQEMNSKFIVPFEKVYYQKDQKMCGSGTKFDLVYESCQYTLSDHFYHRKNLQQKFSYQEVMYIVRNICFALKDLKMMQDHHGKITFKSIVINNQVLLTDPITEETNEKQSVSPKKNKIVGYPSPAVLFNQIDTGMNIDLLKQDLFSVGVIALQLLNPQIEIKSIYKKQSKVYENSRIDFQLVNTKLQKIKNQILQQWVAILLKQNSERRLDIFQCFNQMKIPSSALDFINQKHERLTPEQKLVEETKPPIDNSGNRYPKPHLVFSRNSAPKIVQSKYESYRDDNPDRTIVYNGTYDHDKHQTFYPVNKTNLPEPRLPAYQQRRQESVNFTHQIKPQSLERNHINYHQRNEKKTAIIFNNQPKYHNNKIQFQNQVKTQDKILPYQQYHQNYNPYRQKTVQHFTNAKVPMNKRIPSFQTFANSLQQQNKGLEGQTNQRQITFEKKQSYETNKQTTRSASLIDINPKEVRRGPDQQNGKQNKIEVKGNKLNEDGSRNDLKSVGSKKSVEIKRQIEQQIADLQRARRQNQQLQQKINLGAIQLFDNPSSLIPPESVIQEVPDEDSKIQDSSFVVQKYQDGSRYQGFVHNHKRNGYGKFFYQGGSIYDGQWKQNHMNGYGTLFYPQGAIAYQGNWKNDQFQGKGMINNNNPQMMKGYFDYTNFTTIDDDEWQSYEGQFVESERSGKGKLTLSNGEFFEGQFRNHVPHGAGIFARLRGNRIKGVWVEGKLKTILD